MLFAAAYNCDCKEHLPEACLRIHSRRLQTLTLPVILNFFFNNIYIPFCLAHIMMDGIKLNIYALFRIFNIREKLPVMFSSTCIHICMIVAGEPALIIGTIETGNP